MAEIRQKQKDSIEIITGRPWNSFTPEAVAAYFAFTDKGESVEVSETAENDLYELLYSHNFHSVDVVNWQRDFRKGLLFLSDFLLPEFDGRIYPDRYIQHAFEVYENAMGFIPDIFRGD